MAIKSLIKKFIPPFLLDWYHLYLAFLGAVLYGFPSRKLKVIGVTGTNGKTTVVHLTTQILEEANYKVASLSSIKFKIGEKEKPNTLKMTMPGRFKLQKFFRQAVKAGCQYAVLEVTSEGIKQHRHRFVNFAAAVFTNLTPEHIEAHQGFENYKKAKGKLFQATKGVHIINSDDPNAEYFLHFPARQKILYGSATSVKLNLKLLGDFNYSNALAALQVGLSQGIDLEVCKKALEKVEGIPGRMEEVISQPFKVFVDYAFTPNALEKVYQTLKPKNAKMVCVLGACGGGRDKWKRPVLGEIAAKYCDEIIVTNEDPYDESPEKIINDVKGGIVRFARPHQTCYTISDRRMAIKKSLELAQPGDTVVITGKGCEPWICVKGGKKAPWNEKQVILEEYEKIRNFGTQS